MIQNENMNIQAKETIPSQTKLSNKLGDKLNITRIIALLKKNLHVFLRDYL